MEHQASCAHTYGINLYKVSKSIDNLTHKLDDTDGDPMMLEIIQDYHKSWRLVVEMSHEEKSTESFRTNFRPYQSIDAYSDLGKDLIAKFGK